MGPCPRATTVTTARWHPRRGRALRVEGQRDIMVVSAQAERHLRRCHGPSPFRAPASQFTRTLLAFNFPSTFLPSSPIRRVCCPAAHFR